MDFFILGKRENERVLFPEADDHHFPPSQNVLELCWPPPMNDKRDGDKIALQNIANMIHLNDYPLKHYLDGEHNRFQCNYPWLCAQWMTFQKSLHGLRCNSIWLWAAEEKSPADGQIFAFMTNMLILGICSLLRRECEAEFTFGSPYQTISDDCWITW